MYRLTYSLYHSLGYGYVCNFGLHYISPRRWFVGYGITEKLGAKYGSFTVRWYITSSKKTIFLFTYFILFWYSTFFFKKSTSKEESPHHRFIEWNFLNPKVDNHCCCYGCLLYSYSIRDGKKSWTLLAVHIIYSVLKEPQKITYLILLGPWPYPFDSSLRWKCRNLAWKSRLYGAGTLTLARWRPESKYIFHYIEYSVL